MNRQIDFSELDEITQLLEELMGDVPETWDVEPRGLLWSALPDAKARFVPESGPLFPAHGAVASVPAEEESFVIPAPLSAAPSLLPTMDDFKLNASKGDRLAAMLEILCKRGNFASAIIADNQGLPLAVYNSPVGTEVLAAFTLTLGEAIGKAGHFLGQHEANNISLDINFADKAVVRKFVMDDILYYLLVICVQDVDERGEVELSIDQIKVTLSHQRG
jgi:hypothetical protein